MDETKHPVARSVWVYQPIAVSNFHFVFISLVSAAPMAYLTFSKTGVNHHIADSPRVDIITMRQFSRCLADIILRQTGKKAELKSR